MTAPEHASSDRLVAAPASREDEAVDRAIRPKRFAEYVGQEQVKAQLAIFVQAAVKRVEKEGDLFEPVLKLKQKLPKLEELTG